MKDIRQDNYEGRLDLQTLKRLNTVCKKEYINMIAEEDDQVKEYLVDTEANVEKGIEAAIELMQGIDETVEVWDD